jgi:hypothetical protein
MCALCSSTGYTRSGIAQRVWLLATSWTVRGSNPCDGETRPERPCGPSSFEYNGHPVFPKWKAAREWHLPPTPFSAEVKERVVLYISSPYGFSWPVLSWTLPSTFTEYSPCNYTTWLTFFYSPNNSTCTLQMKTAHSVEASINLFSMLQKRSRL